MITNIKRMIMNPLKVIAEWFDQQDASIKGDFVGMAAHFLLDNSIELEFDMDEKIKKFSTYLINNSLTAKEVMQRTMFLKSLISFTLDGRSSKEGWERARKMNQEIDKKLKSEGRDIGAYDKFMKDYQERKTKWIAWAKEWGALLNGNLSDKNIADWYLTKISK